MTCRLGFSLRRRLPVPSVALALLAIACAAAAYLLVEAQVARGGAPPATSVPVIVAARDVAAGAPLVAEDLASSEMLEGFAPPGAVGVIQDAIGRYAAGPIVTGEVVTTARLASTSVGALGLAPGHVLMRLAVTTLPSVLAAEDRIDVIAAVGGGRAWADVVASDVRVVSVAASPDAGGTFGAAEGGSWIEVDVDTAAALALARAASFAELSVGVRAPPSST